MEPINILSYTSLSTSPCAEHLNIPQGSTCMTKKSINKLSKLLLLNKNKRPLIVNDIEQIPNDGTKEANIIRDLLSIYNVSSERALLEIEDICNVLGNALQKEKDRFKIYSVQRNATSGTDTNDETNVLKSWQKVFTTFYSTPVSVNIKGYESNQLHTISLVDIIKNNPTKKMFAIPLAIPVSGDNGFHATGLFMDMRQKDDYTLEYFDSGGNPPPEYVSRWMEEQRKLIGGTTCIVSKNLVHQLTSTECGLHTLIYYRRRIEGIPYQMFRNHKIPDTFAAEFRKRIYS